MAAGDRARTPSHLGPDGKYYEQTGTAEGASDVAIAAGEAHLGEVGGRDYLAVGTMTRPADTNSYTALDGVTTATSTPAAMALVNAARINGGSGRLTGLRLGKSTATTTNSRFRVWIWTTAPAVPNDNEAYSPAVRASNAALVGWADVDFSQAVAGSDGLVATATLSRTTMAFVCASDSRNLTLIWQARDAYAPGNAEVFLAAADIAAN